MIEYEIVFNNGHVGCYRLDGDFTEKDAQEFIDNLANVITHTVRSTMQLIEVTENKKTLINCSDITTISYTVI